MDKCESMLGERTVSHTLLALHSGSKGCFFVGLHNLLTDIVYKRRHFIIDRSPVCVIKALFKQKSTAIYHHIVIICIF